MSQSILSAEPTIRRAAFLGVLAAMVLWEVAAPRGRRDIPRVVRWTNNLALAVVDTVILRLSFPILAVGLAVMAQDRGWGLFNNVDVPDWVAVVAALGPPAVAVLLFEVILTAAALFNHANIDVPRPVERVLRHIMVTPDMHRVHHSVDPRETNSNYGFNLPWWDRLLGTYIAQPAKGHEGMEIGIEQFRTRRDLWLDRLLIQPVRGLASGHALHPCLTVKDKE